MATERQIAANRQNGKKSTGPRSPAGKAKVTRNALKHGLLAQAALLPGEDGRRFQAFAHALLHDLQPVGALQALLADEIVNLAWRLQRASRVEPGLLVREQAAVDQAWVREQRTKREQQEQHEETVRRASKTARTVYGDAEVDELLKYTNEDDQLDEHEWHDQDAAELQHREEEAAAARWSELGRLGFAFTRSVQQPDPFSKLNRYETSIARRLTRTRHELATLQEAGDRPE
jgi:hypothetical protein